MKRVAIVTGSTRGIGRGIADALWAEGYHVYYSGTGAVRPESLPQERPYAQCDISDGAMRQALIDRVIGECGRLDVLVNNAGVAPNVRADLLDMGEESYDRVMDINLRGTFFLTQLAARAMLATQAGAPEGYAPRIVIVSSISAYTASVNRGEYCIAKAGLAMVTQLYAARLAEAGIPVFEVRPGIIQTDMTEGVRARYEGLIEGGLLPIPRMGTPMDVAGMVLAACSGNLDYTTGQVLNADGGFHLRRL